MVSTYFRSTVFAAILALSASAQPNPPLTAEQRADILMARKMYRESIDVYRESPLDSAVIQNKIGIAYHQMLQFELARTITGEERTKDSSPAEALGESTTNCRLRPRRESWMRPDTGYQ